MTLLRFVLPSNGGERELFIPAEIVGAVLRPAVEHAIGHIHSRSTLWSGDLRDRYLDFWLK
jgi:hypothetical protein